ncbi:hypothetical protein CEQ51_13615 [Pseudomonas thivervalensis]|uniref:Uncharacterized protein n=1 Tax=Pseudomonas thivervalensis TaxID=86265 RepID=A0A2Z4Z5R9_9PSED|nr:hypothetical protein CE140_02130 [Pseudomonas thivervalensis]AXA61064.1 hypothetical protein CEQ51_13615 [Pseudomonas thivervalensis]
MRCLGYRHREQARSHIGLVVNTNFVSTTDPLWERACSRRGHQLPHKPQGSNPIPRKITLVTVCTARSNCMSDSGWWSLRMLI